MAGPTQTNESGFVLVAALWILAALAGLAAIFTLYATNTAASTALGAQRLEADAAFRSGAELVAYQLLAAEEKARPGHGGFAFTLGKTRVSVRFVAEAARIDLNLAPKELLAGLFTSIGLDAEKGGTFADRVIGWRSKVEGNVADPEAQLYRSAGLPYPPKRDVFEDVAELRLLPGVPPQAIDLIMPEVTTFSQLAQVNVFEAAPATITALPGVNPDALAEVLKGRDAPTDDRQQLLSKLGDASKLATTRNSHATRVFVEAALASGRRAHAEMVLQLPDPGVDPEPFQIIYWRDDFDAPL
jgi:general secretion pathway protein K